MCRYKCVFNFTKVYRLDGNPHQVNYHGDGILAFISGFWINDDYKFTKGCDCKYWIPPSQILYIEKTGKESD